MTKEIDKSKVLFHLEQSIQNLIDFTPDKYLWVDYDQGLILPPSEQSYLNQIYRKKAALTNYWTPPTERDDVRLVEAVVKAYCEKALAANICGKDQDTHFKTLIEIKKGLQNLQQYYSHNNILKEKYAQIERQVDLAIETRDEIHKVLERESYIIALCKRAAKKEPRVEDIKELTEIHAMIKKSLQVYANDNPLLVEKYQQMDLMVARALDSTTRVVKNTQVRQSMMGALLSLDLTQINNQDKFNAALKVVKEAFLELYRESDDYDIIKETLINKSALASQNHIPEQAQQLLNYINQNLSAFSKRPFQENLLQERNDILDNAATILDLPYKRQGGKHMSGFRFVNHKLQSFLSLYKDEMDDEFKKIVAHFINQTSDKTQKEIYDLLPVVNYKFTGEDLLNGNYFPQVDKDTERKLSAISGKVLIPDNSINQELGMVFPAGLSNHMAPFIIKRNADKISYNIICANPGAAATGDLKSVESLQHANVIQTEDTKGAGDGKVLIGEVVTEYGPYNFEEILEIVRKAALLKRMKFEFDNTINYEHGPEVVSLMKKEAFQSLLDPKKKLKHGVMDDQTFQVIGNCFVKNVDLLAKDAMASYMFDLQRQGRVEQAKKVEELINIYHQDLMVKKQTRNDQVIPEKKKISLPPREITVNFDNVKQNNRLGKIEEKHSHFDKVLNSRLR